MMHRVGLMAAAVLIAGCNSSSAPSGAPPSTDGQSAGKAAVLSAGPNSSSTPDVAPPSTDGKSAGEKEVAFYVAGMNKRLKIL